jgi:nucleotide-binding universal stress UspA family protein
LQALVASGLSALDGIRVLSVDEESEETANEHGQRAVEYLAVHGIEAESQPKVTDKSVEHVITEEAQRHGVELIVMGAYGRSRLAEFFLGSVTSRVLDESPLPVFLFH